MKSFRSSVVVAASSCIYYTNCSYPQLESLMQIQEESGFNAVSSESLKHSVSVYQRAELPPPP